VYLLQARALPTHSAATALGVGRLPKAIHAPSTFYCWASIAPKNLENLQSAIPSKYAFSLSDFNEIDRFGE